MSEQTVNIVKLAVGVQSVEELALIQRRFLNQAGALANNGFYTPLGLQAIGMNTACTNVLSCLRHQGI